MRLPLHPELRVGAPVEPAPGTGRGETILLVEDDRSVAMATSQCLQRAGFVVLVAADGAQALTALGEQPVDLVLSDVTMPIMGGVELRSRMKEGLQVDVPVAFISGYPSEEGGDEPLLPKPWTPDQLTRFVRECLDAR